MFNVQITHDIMMTRIMVRGEIHLMTQRTNKYVSRDRRVIDINISVVFNNTVTNHFDRSSTIIIGMAKRELLINESF